MTRKLEIAILIAAAALALSACAGNAPCPATDAAPAGMPAADVATADASKQATSTQQAAAEQGKPQTTTSTKAAPSKTGSYPKAVSFPLGEASQWPANPQRYPRSFSSETQVGTEGSAPRVLIKL